MFTARKAFTGVMLAAALALVGCGGADTASSPSGPVRMDDQVGAPELGGKVTEDATGGSGGFTANGNVVVDRKVARSASLWVRVDNVDAAIIKVRAAASAAGGVVAAEETSGGGDGKDRYSTLTLQVPTDKLDATLTRLGEVGTVAQQNVSSVDVTTQVVDIDSRVATLKASVARMQAMMARAETVAELVAIESELTTRQAELESLVSQQKSLAAMVALAPISVTLSTSSAPDPVDNPFLRGLKQGWTAFLDSIEGLLVFLGGVLPFLVVAGLIAWPLIAWRRRVASRRRAGWASAPKAEDATGGDYASDHDSGGVDGDR